MVANPLPTPVAAFERRYRADHLREHCLLLDARGRVVTGQTGDYDSIDLDPRLLEAASGGLLSHSHPRDLPPSGADLALAGAYRLTLRAVGVAPDSGRAYEYTVSGVPPVDGLQNAFDDAVEVAERELAKMPYGDLTWQRESRHLALTRLAERYGFVYQRLERHAPLSEMATREKARLDVLGAVDGTLREQVFTPLAAALVHDMAKLAQNGFIPVGSIEALRRSVNSHVQRLMLGRPDRDGALAPYHVTRGEVVPSSAYFAALWGLLHQAAETAIAPHAAMMRKYLPEDLQRLYAFATLSPFDTSLGEMDEPQYDPLHLWLGPDGKHLSDRIWNAAGDMRAKLDEFLTSAIARRTPVSQMARDLEQFLLPGKGGYEALRLARTETSAAYHRADALAAQGNPFVTTYNFFTAPSHKCCDECDAVEAGSPYPKDDLTHLPPRHPFCVCGVTWNEVSDVKAVVTTLRLSIEQAIAAARTAASDIIGSLSKRFLGLLFRGTK